jgi:membrane-bound serine protease (ClpP class)
MVFMKRLIFILLVSLIALGLSASNKKVYVARIDGEIDLGMAPYLKRVISEAEKNSASAIIFRINTFGGRVDAATQIKDAILNSKVKTIAFIDKRAISAGALIALSCEKIIIVPGSSMGATTVVDQSGTKQSEKYQSYMRSEMRSTAEKNGRRMDIAEGMVDERIVVADLNDDSTKLITLTSEEALKFGMADKVLNSVDDILKEFSLEGTQIIEEKSNFAEGLIKFVNNSFVSSILIMIGLVGLFTEIKTGGWGWPGTAAVIALLLFFGSGYILELVSAFEIVIFVVGVILLLLEIFVIPGFGIVGVLGILLMISGLFLGLLGDFSITDTNDISNAIIQLASSFVMSGILIFILSKFLPKTKMWNNLILHADISSTSGYTSNIDLSSLIGAVGVAMTDLRPAGTAIINSKRIDVVTDGEFIKNGTSIVVNFIQGSRVVVEEKK